MATLTQTVDQDLFDKIFQAPAQAAVPTPQPAPAVVETTPPVEVAATETEVPAKPDLAAEQIQDLVFSAPTTSVDTTTAPAEQAKPEETQQEVSEDEYTNQVFKSAVKKLIKSGAWQDIEDLDDLEINEETFDQLAKLQTEHQIGTAWNTVKQSSPLVNDILDIVEQNGNPEQIVNLFRQRQELTQIDTESTDGKKELIGKYYEEILKYPKAEITRRLKKLDLEGEEEIAAEFSIANQKYGEYFDAERNRVIESEKSRVAAEEAAKRKKLEESVEYLREQKTPDSKIRSQLQAIYAPKYKLDSGEEISEFDYKLLQVRNDPKLTLELAQFVLDKENYLKSKTVAATNEVVDQQFQKLKFKPRPTSTTSSSAPAGRPVKQPAAELLKPFLS